ncbi:gamma-glutamyl-gamma-aminobutyrate hydrolase family protein [Arcanobacterium canis]|uniref:Gamma-glutamyl-gamma-aminobutyrate hydrolase family protein n=1 Tax=Arcanobacterium canis TaxID=999183 RepID=A0ABY8G1K1_9ACTO|nr:gamma-glutamyl-gamma-aminobutyrate hydrolase family protein [Arcanobacterium canis]WFM84135.1 gamma-glutamyl-gamma-aminobutyrate hydrolase family protein [Arcanobacterium canis]
MSRFAFLIARPPSPIADDELAAVRRISGARITPYDLAAGVPDLEAFDAVMISGSPYNFLTQPKEPVQRQCETHLMSVIESLIAEDIPTLGICFGMQSLGRAQGALTTTAYPENISAVTIAVTSDGEQDPLFGKLGKSFQTFTGHSEALLPPSSGRKLSPDTAILATGEHCPIQALRIGKNVYGVQFHPEIDEESLILRINTYGGTYYEAGEAERISDATRGVDVSTSASLIQLFTQMYGTA